MEANIALAASSMKKKKWVVTSIELDLISIEEANVTSTKVVATSTGKAAISVGSHGWKLFCASVEVITAFPTYQTLTVRISTHAYWMPLAQPRKVGVPSFRVVDFFRLGDFVHMGSWSDICVLRPSAPVNGALFDAIYSIF